MKIWFKIWENTHLLKSETIEDDTEDTRRFFMRLKKSV